MGSINKRRHAVYALAAFLFSAPAAAAPLEDPGGEGADDSPASGAAGPFGVGIILGEPAGLTAKLFIAGPSALQLHLGYGVRRQGRFTAILDYLLHFTDAIPPIKKAGRLSPYVGLGARVGVVDDDGFFGVHMPGGLSFMIQGAPVEIFAEFGVGVGLYPDTRAIFNGGLGGRFFF